MFDYEGSRSELLKLLAELGEEPAFIARAKAAEFARETFLHNCMAKREELLEWPYRRLANLAQCIGGNWLRIAPLLAKPESLAELQAVYAHMSFKGFAPSAWPPTEKGSLHQFLNSAKRFNRAWREYLSGIDYESVNKPLRDYNQYYPLEKACAFGNEIVSDDFQPLALIDIAFLESRFPYLPVPQLAA
jgi:hypothetical protein